MHDMRSAIYRAIEESNPSSMSYFVSISRNSDARCVFPLRASSAAARSIAIFLAENLQPGWEVELASEDETEVFALPSGVPVSLETYARLMGLSNKGD